MESKLALNYRNKTEQIKDVLGEQFMTDLHYKIYETIQSSHVTKKGENAYYIRCITNINTHSVDLSKTSLYFNELNYDYCTVEEILSNYFLKNTIDDSIIITYSNITGFNNLVNPVYQMPKFLLLLIILLFPLLTLIIIDLYRYYNYKNKKYIPIQIELIFKKNI
jgi:hypothetical protein